MTQNRAINQELLEVSSLSVNEAMQVTAVCMKYARIPTALPTTSDRWNSARQSARRAIPTRREFFHK